MVIFIQRDFKMDVTNKTKCCARDELSEAI